jgi:hypothetical protein
MESRKYCAPYMELISRIHIELQKLNSQKRDSKIGNRPEKTFLKRRHTNGHDI